MRVSPHPALEHTAAIPACLWRCAGLAASLEHLATGPALQPATKPQCCRTVPVGAGDKWASDGLSPALPCRSLSQLCNYPRLQL